MKRLLSIALAILILASSLGLTLATHYCGGFAMNSTVALNHVDLNCGMGMEDESEHPEGLIIKSICCENDYVSVEIDDQFNPKSGSVGLDIVLTVASVLYELHVLSEVVPITSHFYSDPPPDVELTILHQVFRI